MTSFSPFQELMICLVVSTITGLTGWVLRDLRLRTVKLEDKTRAMAMALFYIIIHDPKVPQEAKRAIEKAMVN